MQFPCQNSVRGVTRDACRKPNFCRKNSNYPKEPGNFRGARDFLTYENKLVADIYGRESERGGKEEELKPGMKCSIIQIAVRLQLFDANTANASKRSSPASSPSV